MITSARSDGSAAAGTSEHGGRAPVAALAACVVAFAVQQTSIIPALQDVRQSLHASQEWTSWLVTVYLMVATVATPAMGRLADLHGRRRVLLGGLAVFAAFSIAAALAPNLPALLVFRAIQGVGGAVYPLTLALARQRAERTGATPAISLLAGAFGSGTAIGFVGGGALADFVNWRAIFAVGAALVILAAAAVIRWVPADSGGAEGGFDLAGTVVLATAAITLLAGLTLVVTLGATSPATIALLALAVVGASAWVRHERRTANPLVDLHVLTKPRVAITNLATIGMGWALFTSFLLIPELARTDPGAAGYGLAASGFAVGLLLLPQALAQTVTASLASRIPHLPPRLVFAAGMVAVAAGEVLLAITRRGAFPVAGGALLLGTGTGLALQSSSAITTQGVGDDVAATSASLNSTVRRLAGGIGGQISTIILAALIATASGQPSFSGFTVSYAIGAGLCLIGGAAVAAHARERGRQHTAGCASAGSG